MLKFSIVILMVLSGIVKMNAQDIEHYYQLVATLDTKMPRKMDANEIMIDPNQKYVIVNYGNKPTYIILYSFEDFEVVVNFRLSDWVEFSGAYFENEGNELYIKESRFSSEYYRLSVNNEVQDIIECTLTPKGCPNIDPMQALKSMYTDDKQFYVTVDKRNPRDVKVYKKK